MEQDFYKNEKNIFLVKVAPFGFGVTCYDYEIDGGSYLLKADYNKSRVFKTHEGVVNFLFNESAEPLYKTH